MRQCRFPLNAGKPSFDDFFIFFSIFSTYRTKVVGHMHMRGVCHRDIKLENILLEAPSSLKIRVCDFGFATGPTAVSCKHSPLYAPPEVLRSGQQQRLTQRGVAYNYLCDEWSVGVCLYILLCGYPPFPSSVGHCMTPELQTKILRGDFRFPPREWQGVSAAAKELICGLLRVDATRRLSSVAALRQPWLAAHAADYGRSMTAAPTVSDATAPRLPVVLSMESSPLFRKRMSKQGLPSPETVACGLAALDTNDTPQNNAIHTCTPCSLDTASSPETPVSSPVFDSDRTINPPPLSLAPPAFPATALVLPCSSTPVPGETPDGVASRGTVLQLARPPQDEQCC